MPVTNIFAGIPEHLPQEMSGVLARQENVSIERIVSRGHCSPEGFWYDQDSTEWVLVLSGKAALLFEGENQARILNSGDYILIPAHTRHRVAWTAENEDTVWLAVHY